MVAYRLAVANTITGQVVGDLPFTAVPTWSRVLNGSGALSGVSVPLNPTRLDSDMRQRLQEPWRWSVLWCYGQTILQAGILSSITVDDTQKPTVAALNTTTLWEFLTRKRLVVTPGQNIGTTTANVVFGPTSPDTANQNLSLHSIARRLVELATVTGDPTYRLPIVLPNIIAGPALVAVPVLSLGATGTAGGTFAAGAYFWKLTALNAAGETAGSVEVTATLVLNGTQVLNWAAVPGATGYRVYRGVRAGEENALITTLGAVTTYTDTGTAGTSAVLPVTNTVRTYLGSDLASTGTRLAELTQVDQGPEVEFAPEFVDSTQGYMQWRMKIGNNRLGQLGFPHAWDYQRALLSLSTGIDGVDMTFNVTSKGQDTRTVSSATPPVASGALISAAASDTTYTGQGWPALQTADTAHTSTIDPATVSGYATAAVTTHNVPIKTATAHISINGLDNQGRQTGAPSIDLVSVGDTAFFGVTGHPFLVDGQYGARILTLESGSDAYTAKMVVQVLM